MRVAIPQSMLLAMSVLKTVTSRQVWPRPTLPSGAQATSDTLCPRGAARWQTTWACVQVPAVAAAPDVGRCLAACGRPRRWDAVIRAPTSNRAPPTFAGGPGRSTGGRPAAAPAGPRAQMPASWRGVPARVGNGDGGARGGRNAASSWRWRERSMLGAAARRCAHDDDCAGGLRGSPAEPSDAMSSGVGGGPRVPPAALRPDPPAERVRGRCHQVRTTSFASVILCDRN